jgi:CheY-like chemotaxis protein/two-component sensor histidine kinase
LDFLERKKLGTDRDQRLVGAAYQSADKARVLVQRLLAFARRQPLRTEAIDLTKLVCGMKPLLESTLGTQITLVLELTDDLAATVDANQLEMALLNLVVNSKDAMPNGGTLKICTSANNGHVQVAVTDTGVGMSEEVRAQAVEPFYSTKGVGKGTGLGLSMVHGLVAQLGGILELTSAPGVGTTVSLILPRAEKTEVYSPNAQASPRRGSKRVLLVDDEPVVRMATCEMLAELGHSVEQAENAQQALSLLESGNFDVLVTDHLMPGMTGAELVKKVNKEWPNMPTLIITGYGRYEELEGLDLLAKPYCLSDLETKFAQFV